MESKLHIDSVHWDKVVVSWCDDKTKMGRNYSIHLEEKQWLAQTMIIMHLPLK